MVSKLTRISCVSLVLLIISGVHVTLQAQSEREKFNAFTTNGLVAADEVEYTCVGEELLDDGLRVEVFASEDAKYLRADVYHEHEKIAEILCERDKKSGLVVTPQRIGFSCKAELGWRLVSRSFNDSAVSLSIAPVTRGVEQGGTGFKVLFGFWDWFVNLFEVASQVTSMTQESKSSKIVASKQTADVSGKHGAQKPTTASYTPREGAQGSADVGAGKIESVESSPQAQRGGQDAHSFTSEELMRNSGESGGSHDGPKSDEDAECVAIEAKSTQDSISSSSDSAASDDVRLDVSDQAISDSDYLADAGDHVVAAENDYADEDSFYADSDENILGSAGDTDEECSDEASEYSVDYHVFTDEADYSE